jgi:hypothetical protein
MPRHSQKRPPRETAEMTGQDLGLEVARDLMALPKEERAKAVRFINVMNETIDRETGTQAATK